MFKEFRGKNKERIFIFILLLVILGFISGGISPLASALPTEAYEKLKIFTDALSKVEESYVEDVDSKELIYGAIKGMLSALDPHSSFMTPEEYKDMQVETKGRFGGLGIEITIKDGILTVVAPIEDTPAYRIGIEAGDKIVKIEDKHTKGMTIQEAVTLLRGPKGAEVKIWIMREGLDKPKGYTIVRDIIKVTSVKSRPIEEGFAYIRIAQFQEKTTKELRKLLKKAGSKKDGFKGLILDLRNNPGGLLNQAVDVSDQFLDSGLIVYTQGRAPGQEMTFEAKKRGTEPPYPMIVLVNGGSASASEIVAGALQDHKRAIILGTTTFGKGSVQTIVPLPDSSAMRITTAKYFTPLGRSIQAKGIEPDIVVEAGIVAKKVNNKIRLKEGDLEGHLAGESEKDTVDKKDEEEEKEKGKEEIKDVQIKRALEYLKSWYIFQGTSFDKAI
ncbi:MAG: S41 family peptidase [Thermodesulfobacteriota bacterium]